MNHGSRLEKSPSDVISSQGTRDKLSGIIEDPETVEDLPAFDRHDGGEEGCGKPVLSLQPEFTQLITTTNVYMMTIGMRKK